MSTSPRRSTAGSGLRVAVRRCVDEMAEYSGPADVAALAEEFGLLPEEIVKLDANENPYGPSPRAVEALGRFHDWHLYPDSEQRELRAALAEYTGVSAEHIMATNGADEMIELLWRTFLDPGDAILDFPPSFGIYAFVAQQYDSQVIAVLRDERFEIDVEQALGSVTPRTKLIVLTSPNNPTGNRLPAETVERLLETGCLVVVDEAYVEFASGSVASWVPQYDNLVVLRTFSKWAGLAGLRLGYGLMPPAVAKHLWKLKQPFNVNQAAVVAAIASLRDREYLLANCRRVVEQRQRLIEELPRVGYLRPHPSEANFILCDVLERDALEVKNALRRKGIMLRHYQTPMIKNCLRVSVGSAEQNDRLLGALREI
jgi:histidinol-phosphate aminotransferase